MPTIKQTHQTAIYDLARGPTGPAGFKKSLSDLSFIYSDDGDGYSSDDGFPSDSEQSLDNEAQANPPSERRVAMEGLRLGPAFDQEEGLHSDGSDEGAGVRETVDQQTISASFVQPEEDDCHHRQFFKDDGISSHGLWPHCAMICVCRRKIIQARGTDLPSIGRGNLSKL